MNIKKRMSGIFTKFPILMVGFLLTVNGMSYHENRTYEQDGEDLSYNENHSAFGLEYEENTGEIVKSAGCVTFINSFYERSNACGATYKMKTPNTHFNDYFGVKAGLVTGYDGMAFMGTNMRFDEFMPYLMPTYSIKDERYEVEFSLSPKLTATPTDSSVIMMLLKVNID